ncbi:MAG: hypothetical protein WA908_02155 [Pontixanthobacter sp.]
MKIAFMAFLVAVPTIVLAQSPDPVVTPVGGEPRVVEMRENHANGVLAKLYSTIDGKAEGLWQEWDEEGRPRYYGEWKNGKGEGVWLYFHPNGMVRDKSRAVADVWHGITEGWHANGVKAFDGEFIDGVRRNPFRYWNEEGRPTGPWAEMGEAAQLSETMPKTVDLGQWPEDFAIWDFSLTPDLQTMFVATGDEDGANRRILQRTWRNGSWQPLEPAPFNDLTAAEGLPIVSLDGEWVYFSSDRQTKEEPENTARELYRASRASGWKDVQRITRTPDYGEISFSHAQDGRGVMWTAGRPGGSDKMGLYEVLLQESDEGTPASLHIVASLNDLHVNDPSGENFAGISRDGNTIVFANYDIGGEGTGEDLYVSRRVTSGWSDPISLGADVNTAAGESNPILIGDGRTLLFLRAAPTARNVYALRLP